LCCNLSAIDKEEKSSSWLSIVYLNVLKKKERERKEVKKRKKGKEALYFNAIPTTAPYPDDRLYTTLIGTCKREIGK